DGGLSDNVGLGVTYDAFTGQDHPWSMYTKINQGKINRVLIVIANARVHGDPDWGKRQSAPGVMSVLELVTTVPRDNYSRAIVDGIKQHYPFRALQTDAEVFRACESLMKDQCPAASMPFEPPTSIAFYAVELAFDNLAEYEEQLRTCLNGLATSFYLPRAQVTLLRQVAQRLLMISPQFREAMQAIAPAWKPREVMI